MTTILHSSLLGTELHNARIDVFAGIPSSIPTYIGQTQFDTSAFKLYVAVDTTSPSDWKTASIPNPITVGPGTPNTVNLALSGSNLLTATVNIPVLSPLLSGLSYTQISDFFAGVALATINTSQLSGTVSTANGGTGINTTPVNGAIIIGNGMGYVSSTISGTANQVIVTNGSGSITLSTPQDIGPTSTPTFIALPKTVVSAVLTAGATLTTSFGTYPINSSSGAFTVTLPSATSLGTGYQIIIVDVGGVLDINHVTVQTAGGDTINGAATFTMNSEYQSVTLQVTASTVWSVI